MYYVYMLRCEDNSLYTGITTDLERRFQEHITKDKKCAKYTLNHSVKKIEIAWITEDRISASKLEYHIKKNLSKSQKEELIRKNNLQELLSTKIDFSKYSKIK